MFTNMVLPLLFNETVYLNKYTSNYNIHFYLNSSVVDPKSYFKSFYENKFFIKQIDFHELSTLTPFYLSFFGKIWLVRFNK